MIKNYFKTAVRNIARNRAFAIINILGLILGISGTIVIYRIISFEQSFDNYHSEAEQIYRIMLVQETEGGRQTGVSVMHPLGVALRNDFPDWTVSRIHWYGPGIFTVENDQGVKQKFRETSGMAFVEQGFFDIFSFDVIAGDKDNILTEPNSMGISTTAADKLFGLNGSGYQSILGKTVNFENQLTLEIKAVYQDPPKNTDYGIDYLMFYEGAKIYPYANGLTSWGTRNGAARAWVKLPAGRTEADAETLLKEASKDYMANINVTDDNVYFELEPLAGIHLDEKRGSGGVIDASVIKSLQLLGVILTLVAAINFVNLATAQSVKRAKEIGIRKVLGSKKSHLVIQFFGEVFLITFIALILSLGLSEASLMRLEPILGYNLGLNLFSEPSTFIFLAVLLFAITLLSGLYPALVLANYNPVQAIKSNGFSGKGKSGGMILRRFLVVLQFFISQFLIMSTVIILFQMSFMQNQPLGFDKDAILTFPIPERTVEKMDLLRSRLAGISGVNEVSFYIASPGGARTNNIDDIKDPKGAGTEVIRANRKNVDPNYDDLFDLKLVAGEFYKEGSPFEHCVINRKLASELGFETPEAALGQRIETNYKLSLLVVGVVEDFHNNSFRSDIDPVFMFKGEMQYFEAGVKLDLNSGYQQKIEEIDAIWSDIFNESVFTFQFLDERIIEQYESEERLSKLRTVFSGMAIFICCLGLYGLISFMANQKVKEIGIRKVLGASVAHIIGIFSREVVILVLIAFAVAAPVTYMVMSGWLDDYQYRISIGVPIFLLAIVATFLIAGLTVGFKATRAAVANPINSLRDE